VTLTETNAAVSKLAAIQQLWNEIERTKPDTPEYEGLMLEIRALSAEYQALVDAASKSSKPKSGRSEKER
jgi:hypothetical protein